MMEVYANEVNVSSQKFPAYRGNSGRCDHPFLPCCTQNLRNSDLLVLFGKNMSAAREVVQEETADGKAASATRFKRLVGTNFLAPREPAADLGVDQL